MACCLCEAIVVLHPLDLCIAYYWTICYICNVWVLSYVMHADPGRAPQKIAHLRGPLLAWSRVPRQQSLYWSGTHFSRSSGNVRYNNSKYVQLVLQQNFSKQAAIGQKFQKMTHFHRHITHIRTHNLYVEHCTIGCLYSDLWGNGWMYLYGEMMRVRVFASSAMFTHAWVLSMSLQVGTCRDGSIYQSSFDWQWRHWSTS